MLQYSPEGLPCQEKVQREWGATECAYKATQPKESVELEKLCVTHIQGCPVRSEWGAVWAPAQELLQHPERVQNHRSVAVCVVWDCPIWRNCGPGHARRATLPRPYPDWRQLKQKGTEHGGRAEWADLKGSSRELQLLHRWERSTNSKLEPNECSQVFPNWGKGGASRALRCRDREWPHPDSELTVDNLSNRTCWKGCMCE